MPCDYKKYPSDWKQIRERLLKQAKNKCELCHAENYKPHWLTKSRVVLTVHHITHDVTDNRKYNLIVLCQRCHNKLDMPFRKKQKQKELV